MGKSMIKQKIKQKTKSKTNVRPKLKEINWRLVKFRYHQSKRADKTKLLNELCDLYGYNRQYLLQVLNNVSFSKAHRSPAHDRQGSLGAIIFKKI